MDERKIDRTDEEGLIDLSRLLREARSVLRRLYWLPLALAAVMALLICLHGWRSYQPMYASEATFTIQVVSGTGSDIAGGGYGYYDKATAEQLGKTFPYLIQSDLMRGKLCRAMGVTTLNGTITAQTVSDTNLFTIRVTSPSAQDAKAILDKVIELYPDVAGYVIGSTSMNLLTQPQVATEPYNAFHPLRSAAKGAALGLVLGLAVVLLCAAARRTVRDTEDVRMKLNQTCLAALPKVRFKQRGKSGGEELMSIQNEHVPSAFQEGVRSLRIKLLRELPEGEGCRTILVTSTLPGEGKTTVAVNLAQSLSRGGARVILVDLDMRKPSVKRASFLTKENAPDPILFLFDEPTTGLHFHDIRKLLDSFDALLAKGHTVVIVEHNMDVIKCADWVIDLGPEAGERGGRLVFEGTPDELARCPQSYTGKYLSLTRKTGL